MKRTLLFFTLLFAMVSYALPSDGTASALPDVFAAGAMALGAIAVLPVVGNSLRTWSSFGLLLATSTVTTALNAAYQAEYRDGSKGLADLTQNLYESAEFDSLFTIDYTDLTVWEKAVSSSGNITQAFQLAFTPNGTFTFTPSKFPLFDIKVDLLLSSHDIKRSFVGFLHKNNKPQTDQEFIRYIISQHVTPQHIEDVEMHGAWDGVYVAPTPGTAGAVGAMMDGFRKYINDAVTATTITPIAVGAAPTDPEDYVDYIEEFAKSLPNPEKKTAMTIAMNLTAEERFREGMRIKYHTYYRDGEADKGRVYVRPNLMVKGFAAMGDSEKIFCAPKSNLIKAVNMGQGPLFNFEQEDRTLKVFGDYMLAYGVWNHKRFYTNDVDLTDES
jgi:hypothetical protein